MLIFELSFASTSMAQIVSEPTVNENETTQQAHGITDEKKDSTKAETNDANDTSEVTESLFHYDRCTSLLSWDEIPFINDEEREGSIKLKEKLEKEHNILDIPPFECARFFIGSKCRIDKAVQKYLDTLKLREKYKFDQITDQQLEKCFKEGMSKK